MDVKCPRCKKRFDVLDSEAGRRGKCAHCEFALTFKPARPVWVSVTVPLAIVAVAVAAVFIFGSLNNTITINQKTETGEMVKTVLHVDHAEYKEKTRKLFEILQRMTSEADSAGSSGKAMSYKGFSNKFGNLADLSGELVSARDSLSDDEKKLGSWLYATSAITHFQANIPAKAHGDTGETSDIDGNTVMWNLRAAAACWKVAAECLNAGDELVVPLDCPMCEGEKLVNCPSCGGVKTVIDAEHGRSVPCKTCGGTGKVTCPVCGGEGKITH
jgi:hypothetical protein